MPKLGGENMRLVVGEGETEEQAGRVFYRDATTDEWTTFQGEMAEMAQGNLPGMRLSTLCHKWGSAVILRAENFDVPEGMDQRDALCKFAPDIVAEIGERVFMRGGGRKLHLGKSETQPDSSSKERSALPDGKTANTSPSSDPPTGTSSAPPPAPPDEPE